jgi:hypothetical protein
MYYAGQNSIISSKYGGLYAFGNGCFLFVNDNGAFMRGTDYTLSLTFNNTDDRIYLLDKIDRFIGIKSFEWYSTYLSNEIDWVLDDGSIIKVDSIFSVDSLVTGKPELRCSFSANGISYNADFTSGTVQLSLLENNHESNIVYLKKYLPSKTLSIYPGISYSSDDKSLYVTMRSFCKEYKMGDTSCIVVINCNNGTYFRSSLPVDAPRGNAVVVATTPKYIIIGFPVQSFEANTEGLKVYAIEYTKFSELSKGN